MLQDKQIENGLIITFCIFQLNQYSDETILK